MNPLPASVGAPSRPQVSLIPPEFGQRRAKTRMRALAFIIAAIAIGAVLAAWFVAAGVRLVAETRLQTVEDERVTLNAKVNEYNYVLEAQAVHQRAITAAEAAQATDVFWDEYIAALFLAAPEGLTFQEISGIQASVLTGFAFSSGGPYNQMDIGSVTIGGRVTDPLLVTDFVVAINAISGFNQVYVNEVRLIDVVDDPVPYWDFYIDLRVTYEALSGRTIVEDGEGE